MKKILNLPSILRIFFGVAQLLLLICGVAWCSLLLVSLAPRTGPIMQLSFDDITLKTPASLISLKSPTSDKEDIRVTRLSTALALNLNSSDRELASAIRWTLLPKMILGLVVSWFFFGLLRNVCARVERGEVFSEANLRSIRNLGLMLVGWSLSDSALQLWSLHRLGGYLTDHAITTGINATLVAEIGPIIKLPYNDLLTGLLVLLLAEAFRQGLALKKENDLTV